MARRLLLLAVWAGLLTGSAEVFLVQIALRGDLLVRLSGDYVWMAPVANVLVAITGTLLILLVGRRRRSWDPTGATIGWLAAIAVMAIAFYLESLHKGAVLLLAAGIGSQAARLARVPRLRRVYALVPGATLALAGWVAYSGFTIRRQEVRREATARSALPVPPAAATNVLLLILDTVRRRASWDGAGGATTTPALDAFARRGVVFDNAIAPAPWTLPSHASFFTGRLPLELSTSLDSPLDDRFPTLAEYLAGKGYFTVGFVANLAFATRASGLARGFVRYRDYPVSVGQLLLSSSMGRVLAGTTWIRRVIGSHDLPNRQKATAVRKEFLAWHAKNGNRPYFAFLNFFDAHEPFFPTGRSGSILWPGPRWTKFEHVVGLSAGANAEVAEKWELTPDQAAVHRAAYLGAASEVDRQVAALLDELDRRGALDNTVVVLAGDHGEQTGEQGRFGHLNSLYLPVLHVPLAIVAPGLPAGRHIGAAVSLRDIPATVVDLLGLTSGAPFPGRSLAPHWAGASRPSQDTVFTMLQGGYQRQARYPIGHGREMFSLTTTAHQYIRNADGSEELYRLDSDPAQAANLATNPAFASDLSQLRGSLDRLLSRTARPPR